ncbi:MAG: RtcB family protein [Thermoanaerobacteraceae bacterium]|nr:RtcB family protein [Thermoanaerobacteraceae bacterium]
MFVKFDKNCMKKPVKVWLEHEGQIDEGCWEQALNLANLPFLHKWVALMPDVHEGYGMPIGGVIATEDVIIPNAVGVDIGCGMCFVETSIHKSEFKELSNFVERLMHRIPTGFDHHKKKQQCQTLDAAGKFFRSHALSGEIERGYYQIGTLGGGNHFIEVQEDEGGMVCIMLHSGSRNFGYQIARYFNELAKQLNAQWGWPVPRNYQLAFLPVESPEGKAYIRWMRLALQFARENREVMLKVVKEELCQIFPYIKFKKEVNCHHNYAALEEHYGRKVWVHRKGAIRAGKGELGIIPGAMGSYSYIVEGRGNPESFCSASHGAGRKLGRRQAKREIPAADTLADLEKLGVVLGKRKKKDVSEESRFAYKDIDAVIEQELDLIKPLKKLRTLAVIKG